MDKKVFKLTILGARGSMSVCGREFDTYGGDTSCYMVQVGDECIFLDAGSGLVGAPVDFEKIPVILLSHLHLDHLLGLGMYPRLTMKGQKTEIYVPVKKEADAREVLGRLYAPPFWPLSFADYAGDISVKKLDFPILIGEAVVDGIEGNHPGGNVAVRIRYGGKSLVYISDYEHEEVTFSRLIDFAKGAELIMYDGQYSDEEYEKRIGFGHSTPGKGIELMEKAEGKRLLLIHHDPLHTDEILKKREKKIGRSNVSYARAGSEIVL
ncbi:MAG: MBL fold metallo-hydrolase [Lachnospiraceae bacterium]|nr:MBL fold metallo-hydrolase [Lachnospiraceae bacterium]